MNASPYTSEARVPEAVPARSVATDPEPPDWERLELPNAWPDELRLSRARDLRRLARSALGPLGKVELPAALPGRERIPRYVLQEFHRLPNGFYSHRIARGYARWFDRTMLGSMARARAALADEARGAASALDLGSADGKLGRAFVAAGVADVSALDPSPYFLQLGARTEPRIRFFHGVAEDLPFADARFEAVGACFLFHELPPRVARAALGECRRVLAPGGRLFVCEPAPEQLEHGRTWRNLRDHGPRALWFQTLARCLHEPYVAGWHALDHAAWLADAGFRLCEDRRDFPWRILIAERT